MKDIEDTIKKETFIKICKRLVLTKGDCSNIDCSDCPGSKHHSPKGLDCADSKWSDGDTAVGSPDPVTLASAQRYLKENERVFIEEPGIITKEMWDCLYQRVSEFCNTTRKNDKITPNNKLKVIIESPYAGNIPLNVEYARACVKDSLSRNEAPIASHLLFTQPGILDDNDPEERKKGIEAGLSWLSVADKHVFYADLGWSDGMKDAAVKADENGIKYEVRKIFT